MGEGGGEEREVKVEDRTEGAVGGGCRGGAAGKVAGSGYLHTEMGR